MKTWTEALGEEKQKNYFQQILKYVHNERLLGKTIYPPQREVFSAFALTEFSDVKVVILGQDPYHGPNQAHGLAFSVKPPVAPPPSLVNMYKELADDIAGFQIPHHGYLVEWAKQGVFMLNTSLTVEQGRAGSHSQIGWEMFTDKVIAQLNEHRDNLVFILWGSHAQKKGQFIDRNRHFVLTSPHPSPLSAYRGFFGCKHFSKANNYLISKEISPINWQLPIEI
ncbi:MULTISPECIES: uracil-DNA glycosylase [Mannheimia]|uniref:Uracil-DNA glycosylase n=1 Tax=Mannheimia pernigra TaxID=111844 RepID=A0A7H8UWT6_9PAST|nr:MULTISPECIES: uracil-DNA glycosylase [Mannheimia]QLB41042.1 uracil-DNA glycosylase [Mannheimia pernigra]QLB45043.1 uracil-DNA glycosylase [Mannheimia pernigra]QTM01604.1 uracil-DNA glycosylase [Mannheimia sp. ZY171111]